LLAFAILVLILVLVNYSISKRLWKAFYKILKRILLIDVKTDEIYEPVPSDIIEFQQLNKMLIVMNEKIRSDFNELKEYADNASHEVQTPLAVIRSKTELILQSARLDSNIADSLHIINQSVTKISRINHSLMLISKIQNNQFLTTHSIHLNKKIEETLIFYRELTETKKIKMEFHEDAVVEIECNEDLIEILLANLMSNAIKHNVENGWIDISLRSHELEIQNSGLEISVDPEILFQRFKKINQSSDSPGLGLSIIRKITDLYKMEIFYHVEKNIHKILLKF
jgi:signal transduction histidine kinase